VCESVSPTVIENKILQDGRDHSGDVGVDGRMQAGCETVNCIELAQYRALLLRVCEHGIKPVQSLVIVSL
jgi:hypothetical protein